MHEWQIYIYYWMACLLYNQYHGTAENMYLTMNNE